MGWDDRESLEDTETISLDHTSTEDLDAWVGIKRDGDVTDSWLDILQELTRILGPAGGRRLYDVGAGDGGFLDLARDNGFEPRGNDILQASVELAARKRGIDLDLGDLSTIDIEPQDAITMWCVMAHVLEPDKLLVDCLRRLRPGGVLFLQTPHRTLVDSAALLLYRATRGRACRLVDRRIAHHHWFLESSRSMSKTLTRLGFEIIKIEPKARYSLVSEHYLESLGIPGRPRVWLGRLMDRTLQLPVAPRIVLDVYARRPLEPAQN